MATYFFILYIFTFPCLLILAFILSSYCGHIFLYSLYFHISMSSNIGFHIFLILWPHIAHSSGNMLLKVLQCCRFSIIMNLNGNLLPENCIADSSFPLSMDLNFGIIEYCQLPAGIFLARVRQEGRWWKSVQALFSLCLPGNIPSPSEQEIVHHDHQHKNHNEHNQDPRP